MTYEIYRYIFIGGAVLAGIMLALSVFVFFFLNIPVVIGDLTGSNARKAIEGIRNQNEKSGEKVYQTSRVNKERGKVTDKISSSGKLIKQKTAVFHGEVITEKIGESRTNEETTVLGNDGTASNETTVLGNEFVTANETTVLGTEFTVANETTVLGNGFGVSNETTVLAQDAYATNAIASETPNFSGFVVEYELIYIHTDEVIV